MRASFGPTAVAALCVAAVFGLSCQRDEGRFFHCNCGFLTDFDDDSKLRVKVCAPSLSMERASEIARGCAQSGAPAPVQGCVCAPFSAPENKACRIGECEVERGRD